MHLHKRLQFPQNCPPPQKKSKDSYQNCFIVAVSSWYRLSVVWTWSSLCRLFVLEEGSGLSY
jgi:hypothetical protein